MSIISFLILPLIAHDGHAASLGPTAIDSAIYWIGSLHPIFLDFPIALITMSVIAEILFYLQDKAIYDHAARFMVLSAAILSIPTVITGLAFGYGAAFANLQEDFFWWHRFLGILTMGLVVLTAYVREYYGKRSSYFAFLLLSFLSVSLTGFLGGSLTFDSYKLF